MIKIYYFYYFTSIMIEILENIVIKNERFLTIFSLLNLEHYPLYFSKNIEENIKFSLIFDIFTIN
jgi:hypothetical protein